MVKKSLKSIENRCSYCAIRLVRKIGKDKCSHCAMGLRPYYTSVFEEKARDFALGNLQSFVGRV